MVQFLLPTQFLLVELRVGHLFLPVEFGAVDWLFPKVFPLWCMPFLVLWLKKYFFSCVYYLFIGSKSVPVDTYGLLASSVFSL